VFKKLALIIIFIFSVTSFVQAQRINIHGSFLKDTIKIGEELPYSVRVAYPRRFDIIFPDSTFDFSPFEYQSREYFPTVSDSLISVDSVVYYLMTFEIDSIQYLQLPVFLKQVEDSASIYTHQDSVILFHVIEQIPDSVKLKENTAFLMVPGQFNYPVFLISIGIILIIIVLSLVFFGKRISKRVQLFLMRRQYRKFVERFYFQIGKLGRGQAGIFPEELLSFWKKYMERLEKEPYTKMTSKELIHLHADQRLKENLRSIDRYIYGNVKDRPLSDNFEKLLEYSKERYEVKVEEVRHG